MRDIVSQAVIAAVGTIVLGIAGVGSAAAADIPVAPQSGYGEYYPAPPPQEYVYRQPAPAYVYPEPYYYAPPAVAVVPAPYYRRPYAYYRGGPIYRPYVARGYGRPVYRGRRFR